MQGAEPARMVSPPGWSEAEELGEPVFATVASPGKKRGRKPKSAGLGLKIETVTAGVQTLFAFIALGTGHKHWNKDANQVQPIAVPLREMLNTLPDTVIDRINQGSSLTLLIAGIATVAYPDYVLEMHLRKGGLLPSSLTPTSISPPSSALSVMPPVVPPSAINPTPTGTEGANAPPPAAGGVTVPANL